MGYGSGANLAAAIAREIRKHKPFTIEKITGLDPLLPTSYAFSFERINKDDANLVDIIHTSTFSSEYSGKIDFFPNGNELPLTKCCSYFKTLIQGEWINLDVTVQLVRINEPGNSMQNPTNH